MVINRHSPVVKEFRALFEPIEGAEIFEAPDNAISMQGMSDREVVIAFLGVETFTAALMRDESSVKLIRVIFEGRSAQLQNH